MTRKSIPEQVDTLLSSGGGGRFGLLPRRRLLRIADDGSVLHSRPRGYRPWRTARRTAYAARGWGAAYT
jgi:hypothetical protein